jgi:DNA polymerase III epsilon subunit-like protein
LLDQERDAGPAHLHGLTRGDLAGAPRFADVAVDIAEQLVGRVVVAHGIDFDLGFLIAERPSEPRCGHGEPAHSGECDGDHQPAGAPPSA